MKIKLTSVFVNDQNKALDFYTKTLGFVKKTDISAGNYRWLTVISAEDPSGSQLVLEPNANPVARTYQEIHLQTGYSRNHVLRRRYSEGVSEVQEARRQIRYGANENTWHNHSPIRRHCRQSDSDHSA